MKWSWLSASLLLLMLSLVAAPLALAEISVSPEAGKIVQQMCDLLKSKEQFTYRAEVAYDVIGDDGTRIKSSFDSKTFVRRPDRLRVDASGEEVNKDLYFDGKTITLYDKTQKVYGVLDAPDDIEGALDMAQKEFDLRVALADLASPKVGELLLKKALGSKYLGKETIGGISCHHVEFSREDVELELWIDAVQDPVPLKIVITHKDTSEPTHWTADLSGWDFTPKLADDVFIFKVPEGVQKIKFVPVGRMAVSQSEDQPEEKGVQP